MDSGSHHALLDSSLSGGKAEVAFLPHVLLAKLPRT